MKRLQKTVLAAGLASLCLAVACGPPRRDRALDIVGTNPTGQFDGVAWEMTKATVKKSGGSADGGSAGSLSIKMFGSAVADCASSASDAGYIIFSMPAKVAKRPLQLSFSDLTDPDNQTVTFVTPPSSNNISVDGILNLTELTDTSMTLGILAEAGSDTSVNGTFTANFCP